MQKTFELINLIKLFNKLSVRGFPAFILVVTKQSDKKLFQKTVSFGMVFFRIVLCQPKE